MTEYKKISDIDIKEQKEILRIYGIVRNIPPQENFKDFNKACMQHVIHEGFAEEEIKTLFAETQKVCGAEWRRRTQNLPDDTVIKEITDLESIRARRLRIKESMKKQYAKNIGKEYVNELAKMCKGKSSKARLTPPPEQFLKLGVCDCMIESINDLIEHSVDTKHMKMVNASIVEEFNLKKKNKVITGCTRTIKL